MKSLQVYSSTGSKTGTASLPKEFDIKPNLNLLGQAIHIYEDRSHKGTSKTKTRSEVNRTRAKIYKQKGTGGARHGDKKAPIFVGGGTAHGPKGIKRILEISKKLKKRALAMVLNLKVEDGKTIFADKLGTIKNTKEAGQFLGKVAKELNLNDNTKVLVALSEKNKAAYRFFRNIKNLKNSSWRNLNAYSVYTSGFIVIDKDASFRNLLGYLTEKLETKINTTKKTVKKVSEKKTVKLKTMAVKKGTKKK